MRTVTSLLFISLLACQKQSPPEAPPAPAAPAPSAAPAVPAPGPTGTATITGTVKLLGTPPEMALTKRQADPFCAKTPMKEEEVIVGPGGGLKNAVVRITRGVTGKYDAPPTPVTLDQSGCMYRPRVQAVVAGQTLNIKNSDQTLHNVHGYKGPSTMFNQAQIPNLGPIVKKLTDADQVLKFKCDVHPWMTAYVVVSPNPFFGVTGDDGSYKIPGVPPGEYTLEVWHERYGTKNTVATVAGDKGPEVPFQYDAK